MICGFLLVIMGQMFADSVGLREYSRSKHDQGVHVGASQTWSMDKLIWEYRICDRSNTRYTLPSLPYLAIKVKAFPFFPIMNWTTLIHGPGGCNGDEIPCGPFPCMNRMLEGLRISCDISHTNWATQSSTVWGWWWYIRASFSFLDSSLHRSSFQIWKLSHRLFKSGSQKYSLSRHTRQPEIVLPTAYRSKSHLLDESCQLSSLKYVSI